MPDIFVTGHRNPDTDSIAAAIGYAELKSRLDTKNHYLPVRLGDVNAQTSWVLERAEIGPPEFLPHVMLRVCDVMHADFHRASRSDTVRDVGLLMAREDVDFLPLLGDDGTLAGVMTERALARRYIRESREASSLDAPTRLAAMAETLEGELLAGDPDHEVSGRVWVLAMATESLPVGFREGDVVVVGDRPDAQKVAIDIGVAVLVVTNESPPSKEVIALAEERGVAMIASPLDSYVSGRMITLSAPASVFMDEDPLTVEPDDLLSDVANSLTEVDYRAAVAVDQRGKPVGLVARNDLVNPEPRKVILVDHAEQAQSVRGIDQAEIVEILDHHHIGSIETRVPVQATFDPVGSTATLVVERFRQHGMEPKRATGILLLGAVMSDTVVLNSPTTTPRDQAVVDYLERALALDAEAFGREMFEATSDLQRVGAEEIVRRDSKGYELANGSSLRIGQVETVGENLDERRDELLDALDSLRADEGHAAVALMVTDIVAKGTQLYLSGEKAALSRAFDETEGEHAVVDMPGVMSRKKQVAPKLLSAFG